MPDETETELPAVQQPPESSGTTSTAVSPPPADQTSGATSTSAETSSSATSATAAPEPKHDWKDARFRRMYAENQQLKKEAREREAAAASSGSATTTPAAPDPSEFTRQVNERVQAEMFARECNDALAVARREFPDFDQRLVGMQEFGQTLDAEGQNKYGQLIRAALATGDGPKLINAFASDLNNTSRLLSLSPVQMGMELAKMTQPKQTPVAAAPTTRAPDPVTPISGAGGAANPIDPAGSGSDKLSTEEWMARRNAQVEARNEANGRGNKRYARR